MLSLVFVTLLFFSPFTAWADDGVVVEKDGTMRVGVPGAVLDLTVTGKCDGDLWIYYPTTVAPTEELPGALPHHCAFYGPDYKDYTTSSKCPLDKDSDGFMDVIVEKLPGGCTVSFPNAFLHRKSDGSASGVPVAAIVVPVVIGVLLLTAVGIFVGWKCWRRRRSVGNSAPAPVIFPTKPEDPAKEEKAVPPHDGLPEVVVEKPPRPPPTTPAPAKPKAPVPSSGVPPTSTAPTPTPTQTPPPTPTPSAPPVTPTPKKAPPKAAVPVVASTAPVATARTSASSGSGGRKRRKKKLDSFDQMEEERKERARARAAAVTTPIAPTPSDVLPSTDAPTPAPAPKTTQPLRKRVGAAVEAACCDKEDAPAPPRSPVHRREVAPASLGTVPPADAPSRLSLSRESRDSKEARKEAPSKEKSRSKASKERKSKKSDGKAAEVSLDKIAFDETEQ